MSAPSRANLYAPPILALAVELAQYRIDPSAPALGEARSRTCGSTVAISSGSTDRVQGLGLKVTACAIGQAAAAIFARDAEGRSHEEIAVAAQAVGDWLSGERPQPDWPRIGLLEPARAHPARHEAILLPWRAALRALSKPGGER